ncbi:hypothetical protein P9112_003450 [Eukaryota sp. TZLM1-RC]
MGKSKFYAVIRGKDKARGIFEVDKKKQFDFSLVQGAKGQQFRGFPTELEAILYWENRTSPGEIYYGIARGRDPQVPGRTVKNLLITIPSPESHGSLSKADRESYQNRMFREKVEPYTKDCPNVLYRKFRRKDEATTWLAKQCETSDEDENYYLSDSLPKPATKLQRVEMVDVLRKINPDQSDLIVYTAGCAVDNQFNVFCGFGITMFGIAVEAQSTFPMLHLFGPCKGDIRNRVREDVDYLDFASFYGYLAAVRFLALHPELLPKLDSFGSKVRPFIETRTNSDLLARVIKKEKDERSDLRSLLLSPIVSEILQVLDGEPLSNYDVFVRYVKNVKELQGSQEVELNAHQGASGFNSPYYEELMSNIPQDSILNGTAEKKFSIDESIDLDQDSDLDLARSEHSSEEY